MTVDFAPTVLTNPRNQTVTAGTLATFKASAANPTATVQWQVSTDGGVTFTNISGATRTTLPFVATAHANGDKYRAVFTNSIATTATTAGTLTV